MSPQLARRLAFAGMLAAVLYTSPATTALADGPPPRDLESPAAQRMRGGNASEYWDLTIELEQGYVVVARFLITNQGPGKQSGVAVGYAISPDGKIAKFQNGKLQSGWRLSRDGKRLDIGKCHLDMQGTRYTLSVTKSSPAIELTFEPNALYRLPKRLLGRKYRVDLLALGAPVSGTLRLSGMRQPMNAVGWATLTHTVSSAAETDANARRIELFAQRGENPLYIADFLSPAGKRSRWLGYLESPSSGCDPAVDSPQPRRRDPDTGAPLQNQDKGKSPRCLRRLIERTAFDLALGDAIQPPPTRAGKDPYWIPLEFNLKGLGPEGLGREGIGGRVARGKRLLEHDPLGDLPGPIRFLAGLSTKPRRVWSAAMFDVTISSSLNSKPIQVQGQGISTVSYLNHK